MPRHPPNALTSRLKVHTTNVSTGKDAWARAVLYLQQPSPQLLGMLPRLIGVDDYSQPDIHFEMNV